MAATMLKNSRNIAKILVSTDTNVFMQQTRTRVRPRGKPPGVVRTWAQRLKEIEDHLNAGVRKNIGLSSPKVEKLTRHERRRMQSEKNMEELERLSRKEELVVPLDEVNRGEMGSVRQQQLYRIACHYGIFRDLYSGDYFYPQVNLQVLYEAEEEEEDTEKNTEEVTLNPVFYGNVLDPSETKKEPYVEFTGEEGKLYTLCMTAPDTHLQNTNMEYLHWMVGNIPGSGVEEGTVVCDYLRPFPLKGTGFHRYVFVLYQHDSPIDFSDLKITVPCKSLLERSFNSGEFYQQNKDSLKPVGLAFFQSEWDETVRQTFHNILDMGEPRFDYIVPKKFIPKQQIWPLKEPFNVYMDRYRDMKDISEEVLREKLKNAHPFQPRPPTRKYPNVYKPDRSQPSWLRQKINEQVLRRAHWKGLDD